MTRVTSMTVEWNRRGITREVILTRRYAIKIPKLVYGWDKFLRGLLANMQETLFSRANFPELCPVIFSIPGGWLLVMPRVAPLSNAEWSEFDVETFCNRPDYLLPVERKQDSFGKLNGRIVAIDYGN